MSGAQNPRVTAEDKRIAEECVEAWDATRNGFNPCGDRDAGAQVVAAHREAAEAACLAGCEIYLKPGQTPAARMKQDHEVILGLMKLLEKTKWALQDAVRTSVENCRQRDWWMNAHATVEAELTANERKVDELIAAEAASKAREAALVEALTPSGDTKAAYHGEFSFQLFRGVSDAGIDQYEKVYVPWTTVKEIMAAISARAALTKEPDA